MLNEQLESCGLSKPQTFSHIKLIISIKVNNLKPFRLHTTTLAATGAPLLLHPVDLPHSLVLMYYCSKQLGRELAVDASPLVQQQRRWDFIEQKRK